MSRGIRVALSGRTPNPRRIWDHAYALGQAMIARHPDIEQCTISVHGNVRAGLRWRIGPKAELSLHWALTPHPDAVMSVLCGEVGAWDRLQTELPSPARPRTRTAGAVHDLVPLLAEARTHAPPVPDPIVTWGRFSSSPPVRTLRLGSCSPGDPPVVRIHPVLDHSTVPGWFVGFVLFHELLHLAFPPAPGSGSRRVLHSPALAAAERRHPDHARAIAFERAHVGAWLKRCADAVRR